jgi:hypothetical protein
VNRQFEEGSWASAILSSDETAKAAVRPGPRHQRGRVRQKRPIPRSGASRPPRSATPGPARQRLECGWTGPSLVLAGGPLCSATRIAAVAQPVANFGDPIGQTNRSHHSCDRSW